MDFHLADILAIGPAQQQMKCLVPALFDQLAGQQPADQAGGADDQDFFGDGQGSRILSVDKLS